MESAEQFVKEFFELVFIPFFQNVGQFYGQLNTITDNIETEMKEEYNQKIDETKKQLRDLKDYAPRKPTINSSRKNKLKYFKHQQNCLKKRNELKQIEKQYQMCLEAIDKMKQDKKEIDKSVQKLNEMMNDIQI